MSGAFLAPEFEIPSAVVERARAVRLVLFDVDGVLTDGRLILDDDGREYKAFHTHDGHGIKLLQRSGVAVGIISGRTSRAVELRARELDIKHLHQGCAEKLPVCRRLLSELGVPKAAVAFVGDDVVDLPIMLDVGLGIAVADAHPLVKRHAHWVTPSAGGRGAARDACELILHAHGRYTAAMQEYLTDKAAARNLAP